MAASCNIVGTFSLSLNYSLLPLGGESVRKPGAFAPGPFFPTPNSGCPKRVVRESRYSRKQEGGSVPGSTMYLEAPKVLVTCVTLRFVLAAIHLGCMATQGLRSRRLAQHFLPASRLSPSYRDRGRGSRTTPPLAENFRESYKKGSSSPPTASLTGIRRKKEPNRACSTVRKARPQTRQRLFRQFLYELQ